MGGLPSHEKLVSSPIFLRYPKHFDTKHDRRRLRHMIEEAIASPQPRSLRAPVSRTMKTGTQNKGTRPACARNNTLLPLFVSSACFENQLVSYRESNPPKTPKYVKNSTPTYKFLAQQEIKKYPENTRKIPPKYESRIFLVFQRGFNLDFAIL